MIKLSLNRYKIVSLIRIVEMIAYNLLKEKQQLKYSMKRAEISAHIYILQGMSRKLRSKFVMIEHKQDKHKVILSIDEMQAYVLILYKDFCIEAAGYELVTMQEISVPIFKHLLN